MAKPVIFSVDDDPEVLGAVERDLRQHYRSDYRIMKAGSGREALEAARQLKQRATAIALFRGIAGGEERELDAAAMFIFIGAKPRTEMVSGLLELDEKGFVLTGPDLPRTDGRPRGWPLDRDPFLLETSVPGVFAAGDVRAGSSKRVAAAVGEGSGAVGMVHRYLETV